MPPKVENKKRMHLNVVQKLKVIKKIEDGASVGKVCEEFGVKRQTVYNIIRTKDKLQEYAASYSVDACSSKDGIVVPKKNMRVGKDKALDAAVMKWYTEKQSSGVMVYKSDILAAATKLAAQLGNKNFKGSEGWLWRFKNRHGLLHKNVYNRPERKVSDVANSWKKLLEEPEPDSEDFEADDFCLLNHAEVTETSIDDVREKVDNNKEDPSNQVLTQSESAAAAAVNEKEAERRENQEKKTYPKVELSTLLQHVDALLDYTSHCQLREASQYHSSLQKLRELIIIEEQKMGCHLQISSCFVPQHPTAASVP